MKVQVLVLAVLLVATGIILVKKRIAPVLGKVLLALTIAGALAFVALFAIVLVSFGSVNADILSVLICIIAVLIMLAVIGALWGFIKKKQFYIPLICCIVICTGSMIGINIHQSYVDSIPTVNEGSSVLYGYSPFMENSKIAKLDEESSLKITEDLPVLDGATALYPVYAAFARAVYPEEVFVNEHDRNMYDNEYLYCSTTAHAYERIVTGEADIIFVASPSEQQAQVAKDCGVELVFTPVGREAFVFFVNSKNPIEDIALEDVRKIYSGEITRWSELGVDGFGKIRAFQREEGSGSQSTLEKLMADKTLIKPLEEDVVSRMGGIIRRTADYKNYKNAIGYSFRFYSTEMVKNDMVKLLRINGAEPTLENIENGTYPIASEFYAVTRSDATENTLKLLEWVQGEQGQRLVELTGYTPIN